MDNELVQGRKSLAFTQTPQWIVLSGISARTVQLYDLYAMHLNRARADNDVWPSRSFLAWVMGLKRGTYIDPYNRELVKIDAIEINKRTIKTGRINVITVHELPPEGYKGLIDLAHAHRIWRDLPLDEKPRA